MNATEQKDLQKLKRHIETCPSIPPDSLVSRIVLKRLDEKLNPTEHEQSYDTNGYATSSSRYVSPPSQDQTYAPSRQYTFINQNRRKKATKIIKPKIPHGPFDNFFKTIRIMVIDLPLTLLFISIVATHLIHKYYINYVTPMIEAANWADNDRLESEFTYYDRHCDASDITASSIDEVTVHDGVDSSDDAVENFMVHGMSLFTDILDQDVSTRLRTYIRKRNIQLTADEVIPLDTPEKRYSFGINANEDPSVAEALNQIGSHNLLKETLEKLLGEDPAVAEITAITVEPGARAQGWHPDVKPLGSSIKYGQTFTHSYSLFIPLQDVTKRMGATELCPGTHYCGSEDLEQACVKRGFQASESNVPSKAWKTGHGLMMNQKMWHRGGVYNPSRHLDNPDRVVFILTFISRPNFGKDHRQLSHGTYFHIHPFMYGHTFQDLKKAQVSMSFPFSMFRSIGIWKPQNANWGYDWVTTSALRISNGENGYHYEDLEAFVLFSKLGKSIPSFLHGDVSNDGGWKVYIEDTISRFKSLFTAIYVGSVVIYLLSVFTLDFVEGFRRRRVYSTLTRIVFINLVIVFCAYKAAEVVKETQFCKSVDTKTIYSTPFLPKSPSNYNRVGVGKNALTTVPTRSNVLFGNRYDSKLIGNYINFLNYHPANKELRQQYDALSDIFHSYKGLPNRFQNEIVDKIDASFDQFLSQNEFGEWTLMEEEDKVNNIILGLTFSHPSMGLMNTLDKELAILLSKARFGTFIRSSTAMKKITISSLQYLRDNVIRKMTIKEIREDIPTRSNSEVNRDHFNTSSIFYLPSSQNERKVEPTMKSKRVSLPISNSQENNFDVGDEVLFNYQGSGYWIHGKIIHKEHKSYGHVERNFDDGLVERSGVVFKRLKPYRPLVEGQEVALIARECNTCRNEYFPGKVSHAYPDASYDIEYESGDIDTRMSEQYIVRKLL